MIVPYVRAKSSDGRWVSVAIEDLDEKSFRRFILSLMCRAQLISGIDQEDIELTTPLTKAQVEDPEGDEQRNHDKMLYVRFLRGRCDKCGEASRDNCQYPEACWRDGAGDQPNFNRSVESQETRRWRCPYCKKVYEQEAMPYCCGCQTYMIAETAATEQEPCATTMGSTVCSCKPRTPDEQSSFDKTYDENARRRGQYDEPVS